MSYAEQVQTTSFQCHVGCGFCAFKQWLAYADLTSYTGRRDRAIKRASVTLAGLVLTSPSRDVEPELAAIINPILT